MDNRRAQITTALAIVIVAIAIGYFFFIRGALAEQKVPSPDSADYSVAQLSLRADPETIKASQAALAGGDINQLLEAAAPDGLGVSVEKKTANGATVTLSGDVDKIFELIGNLGGVSFVEPDADGGNLGQIRGDQPLVVISSMKLANDTGTDSASASMELELARLGAQ